MLTLKKIAMSESNPVTCTQIMRNVLQILNTCPAMASERLAEADDCGKLMHSAGSAALGMLVFEVMQYRRSRNKYFETLSATLKSLHDTVLKLCIDNTKNKQTNKQDRKKQRKENSTLAVANSKLSMV